MPHANPSLSCCEPKSSSANGGDPLTLDELGMGSSGKLQRFVRLARIEQQCDELALLLS